MCKSKTCPNCRSSIMDECLIERSIDYGIEKNILILITEIHVPISLLGDFEVYELEGLDLYFGGFLTEPEWEDKKQFLMTYYPDIWDTLSRYPFVHVNVHVPNDPVWDSKVFYVFD